jgi:excisionase family DNA binding protein
MDSLTKTFTLGDLLTKAEAAEYARVATWTVDSWLTRGLLPRTKMGARTLVRMSDLQEFCRKSTEQASKHHMSRESRAKRAAS